MALALLAAGLGLAQSGPAGSVWEGAYTEAQAERGATAFARSCAGCHAVTGEGRAPVVGDAFWKSFSQKTAGDVLEFISKYMPNGSPGSLSEAAYEDISAYMLKANGFPAGARELRAAVAARIVPRDGSTELPANALVRVVGCLARNGADWVVRNATVPERAESAAAGADATRPLGSRELTLKFVLTKLDALAGSRVAVTGLLMGTGGADGINVMTVSRAAAQCP